MINGIAKYAFYFLIFQNDKDETCLIYSSDPTFFFYSKLMISRLVLKNINYDKLRPFSPLVSDDRTVDIFRP